MSGEIEVYSTGLVCCSVCAPVEMTKEQVEEATNNINPTGIASSWAVADDEFFADGKSRNGDVVGCHNGTTRHWLLQC